MTKVWIFDGLQFLQLVTDRNREPGTGGLKSGKGMFRFDNSDVFFYDFGLVLNNSVWACVVAGEPGIHPIRLLDAVISSS